MGRCAPRFRGADAVRVQRAGAWRLHRSRRLDPRADPRRDPACAFGRCHPAGGGLSARLWPRQTHPAARLAHRAGSARRRHGRLGRRAVLGQARLDQAVVGPQGDADRRGEGVPRWSVRRALRDARRLGHPQRAERHAAACLGLPQGEGLPRDAHLQGAWRPRLLGPGAVDGGEQDREPLGRGRHHRDGAEFARAGRAAREVRHAGAEGDVSPPPRDRTGSAVLRAHRPACRFGCRGHARRRRRRPGDGQRQEGARHPAELGQALHHARARRDAARSRLPSARSRSSPQRGREPRDHARADPRRLQRRRDRPPPLSGARRLHERPDARQERLRPDRLPDRRTASTRGRAGAC